MSTEWERLARRIRQQPVTHPISICFLPKSEQTSLRAHFGHDVRFFIAIPYFWVYNCEDDGRILMCPEGTDSYNRLINLSPAGVRNMMWGGGRHRDRVLIPGVSRGG